MRRLYHVCVGTQFWPATYIHTYFIYLYTVKSSVKVTEKLSKYKDPEIEIERMWGMKATTIQVVIGALGLIKKGFEKYTKQIPGNIKISELQKIALLGTSRILRKTLSIK